MTLTPYQILTIAVLRGCSVASNLQVKLKVCKKKALRFLIDDNTLCYEDLLEKEDKEKMRVLRLIILCIEIYNKQPKPKFYE